MDRFYLEDAILKANITDELFSVLESMHNGDPPELTKRLLEVFIDLSLIRNEQLWDTFCKVFELDDYAPSKREWVGLTDEEIDYLEDVIDPAMYRVFARRIEAKLKEKNT